MKCKNSICQNKTNGKNIYCSSKCRNFFVNKYLRDYTKNGQSKTDKKIKSYEDSPKFCRNPKCGKKIEYLKRRNDFCNHSCSASITNLGMDRKNQNISNQGYNNIIQANEKRRGPNYLQFSTCNCCGKEIKASKKIKYCSNDCRKKNRQKNMSEYEKYKLECSFRFNLSDYPEEFDFSLIEKYGWYKPVNRGNNLGGVSRDHMISVNEGFSLGLDVNILSHPANCKLMIHNENIRKNKKSTITVEELLLRIEQWKIKYEQKNTKVLSV